MCTVTLIQRPDSSFILTSNRDEAINRETLAPKLYSARGHQLMYPKDMVAGGTWIGMSDNKSMVCLLNGGSQKHIRKATYRLSRGVVVKELLCAKKLYELLNSFDYEGIEPFTVVAAQWKEQLEFYELTWDGESSHLTTLDNASYIWSSSTLYDEEAKRTREFWFSNFLKENPESPEQVLNFHKTAGQGNTDIGLQMDRGLIKTRSVTQIVKSSKEVSMRYETLSKSASEVTYCFMKEASLEVVSK